MTHFATESPKVLEFGNFQLDLKNECLWSAGELIRLQRKTFSVLHYLTEHAHQLVRKEELLREVWGELHVSESVLKTHLNLIRGALRDSARKPRVIETVHGRGYRFIAEVRAVQVDETCSGPFRRPFNT